MTQFLLVFRDADGDHNELRDTTNGESHVNGSALVDGGTFVYRGIEWLATREDLEDGLVRFVCTPLAEEA
jgi:hypothetical protein